jgi:hypothetical protein
MVRAVGVEVVTVGVVLIICVVVVVSVVEAVGEGVTVVCDVVVWVVEDVDGVVFVAALHDVNSSANIITKIQIGLILLTMFFKTLLQKKYLPPSSGREVIKTQ